MSRSEDIKAFVRLKKAVAEEFLRHHPSASPNLEEWKGQEITDFQDHLIQKVNGQVSEKWFYTYFKSGVPDKLPRIDMLNLLSRYAGWDNWNDFKFQRQAPSESTSVPVVSKKWYVLGYLILTAVGLFAWNQFMTQGGDGVQFCFYDQDRNEPITNPVRVEIINFKESPRTLVTSGNSCVAWDSDENVVQFAVHSPYYKSDTIVRALTGGEDPEIIYLKTDDYALMLHYFSKSKVEDWKQRRRELNQIIHDDAIIYQVFGQNDYGVDLYSKEELINKMTLPTSSLRQMDILETRRKDGKIVQLKFKIRDDEE
ncbi:hypothetical protein KFE98_16705 [bacterium SCSIO 12741]|nr:hypothetical protein KFE98_16705 [bacterium SCSIO 12741]